MPGGRTAQDRRRRPGRRALLEALGRPCRDLSSGTTRCRGRLERPRAGGRSLGGWAGRARLLPGPAAAPRRRPCAGRSCRPPGARFSPLAAVSTVVLLASGLYQAGVHLPDLGPVRTTVYGAAVAAKTVLVVVALGDRGAQHAAGEPRTWPARVGARLGRRPGWAPLLPGAVRLRGRRRGGGAGGGRARGRTGDLVPTAREVVAANETPVAAPRGPSTGSSSPSRRSPPVRPGPPHRPAPPDRPCREPGAGAGVDVVLGRTRGSAIRSRWRRSRTGRYEATTAEPRPGTWLASVSVMRTACRRHRRRASWKVERRCRGRHDVAADHDHGARRCCCSSLLRGLLLLRGAGDDASRPSSARYPGCPSRSSRRTGAGR